MDLQFENTALEELYRDGFTTSRKYKKLPTDIIKRYIKVVDYLKVCPMKMVSL